MKTVICQPTYLPWMGYFGMIDIADVFVFYDDVQYEKSSWQSRNRIKSLNGDPIWLSVPSMRDSLQSNINEIKIKNTLDWRKKHWMTIYHTYHKAPFFLDTAGELENIYGRKWEYLCDLNIAIIKLLANQLSINTPVFIKSSELGELGGKKTDRVLNVLEKLGSDEYISAEGTKAYLETNKLRDRGIKLYWYEYKHPIYPQMGKEFVQYMSVVDLLFNSGNKSIEYIREGLCDALVEV